MSEITVQITVQIAVDGEPLSMRYGIDTTVADLTDDRIADALAESVRDTVLHVLQEPRA